MTVATRVGEHVWTLTVTDIDTGWTENRSVPTKAVKWAWPPRRHRRGDALPVRGIDSDNGSEFINFHLLGLV